VGEKAGVVAVMLMACLPIEVLCATTLLTEVVVSAAVTASVTLLILAGDTSAWRRNAALFMSGAALGVGFTAKESAAFVAPALIVLGVRSKFGWRAIAAFGAGVLVGILPALFCNLRYTGQLLPSMAGDMSWSPFFGQSLGRLLWVAFVRVPSWFLNPLSNFFPFFGLLGWAAVVGVLLSIRELTRSTAPFLLWIMSYGATLFFGCWLLSWFIWGKGLVLEEPRYLMPGLVPVAILGGQGYARLTEKPRWRILATVGLVVVLLFAVMCISRLYSWEIVPKRVFAQAAAQLRSLHPKLVCADRRSARTLPFYFEYSDDVAILELQAVPPQTNAPYFVFWDERQIDVERKLYGRSPTLDAMSVPPDWQLLAEYRYPPRTSIRQAVLGKEGPPGDCVRRILIYRVGEK
jgi:hypothetical protein